jgi:osmoprotectant transport system permease protein
LLAGCGPAADTRVGSKLDNESVLLGEMAAALVRDAGEPATHRRELGGTPVVWNALLAGEIDLYPEFTGTLAFQTLGDPSLTDFGKLKAALAAKGVGCTGPLGYENNYAIGVRGEVADRLTLRAVSDLARHPDLRLRLTPEFVRRADGWPALKRTYALPHPDPDGTDHALAYRAVAAGAADVLDVYTTEAEIDRYGVRVLRDDRQFFPRYAALFVYRQAWADAHPRALASLRRLEGSLTEDAVRRLNARTQGQVPEATTAADFLRGRFGLTADGTAETAAGKVWRHAREHLFLVGLALGLAVPVAVPLGVLAARRPRLGQVVVGLAGLVQTVPSLALLVLLVALPPAVGGGLGWRPAVVALFLYALLPVIRNTATGLTDIPRSLRETAAGIGLTPWQSLRTVELPLAARGILAGVKTAAVITVGTATLGALIDAGGLGVPIQQGLRTNDRGLILLGAVPAAGLALVVQGLFEVLERLVVPRGLR